MRSQTDRRSSSTSESALRSGSATTTGRRSYLQAVREDPAGFPNAILTATGRSRSSRRPTTPRNFQPMRAKSSRDFARTHRVAGRGAVRKLDAKVGCPRGRLFASPDPRRSESGCRLQHEYRDLPVGLGLVLGVVRPDFHRAFPPVLALVAGHLARGVVALRGSVLKFHQRMLYEVAVPGGMLGSSAFGCDRGVYPVVLDSHNWVLAELPGASTQRSDDDHRHVSQ